MAIIRHRQGIIDINANRAVAQPDEYTSEQNVEVSPVHAAPQHGNTNIRRLKGLYEAWNAQYRGLTQHGINPTAITAGAAIADAPDDSEDHGDNPQTFDESGGLIETQAEPEEPTQMMAIPVTIVDDTTSTDDYFHTYSMNVGAVSPLMVVAPQKFRARCYLVNVGIQPVYIGENESRGLEGFPLYPPVGTAPFLSPSFREIPTSREIWAIADPAAAATFVPVKVLITYERRMWTP